MTEQSDASAALDAERKRLARRPPRPQTAEQRERKRVVRSWQRNRWHLWHDAHLLFDDELIWLAAVTEPVRTDDAVKGEKLGRALYERERKWRRKLLIERLDRLGLQTPRD